MSDQSARPAFVLRVGVTGSRQIPPEHMARLRGSVDDILALVAAEATRLAQTQQGRRVYARDATSAVPVTLRMISPLADGADRLVADAALDLGYELISPLPFAQADYECDFPPTVDAFRHLLAKARVIELDGGRGAAEALSYEAVGRFVVRNCDLLIALWDGKPAKGQGGTADIVRYSARSNVPVWWIDIETGDIRFLASSSQWRGRDLAPSGIDARARLTGYLLNLILPPKVVAPKRHGILGFVAHHYCRITDSNPHPVDVFLAEPAPQPTPVIWQLFSRVYRLLAAPARGLPSTPFQPPPDTDRYWLSRYERADALSVFYGDRYRSSYVFVIFLAFLAFALSIAGAPFSRSVIEIGLEFVLFAVIGGLVFANHLLRWHEQWLSYRLVAELCRNQVMLMPLGRSMAGVDINRLASDPSMERGNILLPRDAWVSWYYLATLRAAPFDPLSATSAKRNAFAVARSLVAEQEGYHRLRHQRADTADHRLALYSDWFGGGLAAILALVWLRTAFRLTVGIETVVTLFSGASAAFVGLRGYAEFALLAQQSLRMETIMHDTAAELDDIDVEAPLSSQELGAILERLASSMMQDVSGWAQLFRQTTPETS